ncbi:MAG TPA: type II CAAX endopeptidase family protein [Lacunisphaera sp.]
MRHTPFPFKSLLLFIAGAVVLRLLSIVGWVFFPGDGILPQLGRILIPLCFSGALVVLNQKLLAHDGFGPDALGLKPNPARIGVILASALVITLIFAAMAAALRLPMPFHYQRGPLTLASFGLRAIEYLGGNAGEELIFRGYLLLLLRSHCGLPAALVITGLLFGCFHLPGLSGVAALKMVCTTFLGGTLFAYGFLLSGTLWSAISLHVVGNIVLHHVFGLSSQPSLLTPVFDRPWPTAYDPAFLVWLAILIPAVATAAYRYHHANPSKSESGQ